MNEFYQVWTNRNEEAIYTELIFCLLTPQSKAFSCWNAVQNLINKELLIGGRPDRIAKELAGVRFCNNKSIYVAAANRQFVKKGRMIIVDLLEDFKKNTDSRDWLVDDVKGLGYKEASHFLRNIGLGKDLAILDRHILRNLVQYGVIDELPRSLSKNRYLEIEEQMLEFSKYIEIPMEHLDLLLWYKQTGKIFK